MSRLVAFVCAVACVAGLAFWYYRIERVERTGAAEGEHEGDAWVEQLYSQNPGEAAEAARHVEQLGARALPAIHAVLQDPGADPKRVKAVLKACGILGHAAAAAIPEVAENLADPTLTAEAATALSFMGRGAFAPLREALGSDDPVVRQEALRAIGKLKGRAPLDSRAVLPLLIRAMKDPDAPVRTVAATYLGIVHEGGGEAVAALIAGLGDPDANVRRASATALGSFGGDAAAAVPALKKAAVDADPEVAREAGVTLVKLQPGR